MLTPKDRDDPLKGRALSDVQEARWWVLGPYRVKTLSLESVNLKGRVKEVGLGERAPTETLKISPVFKQKVIYNHRKSSLFNHEGIGVQCRSN